MHKWFYFLFSLLLCTAFIPLPATADDVTPQQLVEEAQAQVRAVTIHSVKKMMDSGEKIILLDVRGTDEFEKSHIPGAINIPRGLLEFMAGSKLPDKSAKIVVY